MLLPGMPTNWMTGRLHAADTHPTVVLLPALLAVSNNRPVSGQQLLTAYAVGFELIARLGESVTLDARLGESVTLDHYNRGALHCNH